jgi:hypothetical protein
LPIKIIVQVEMPAVSPFLPNINPSVIRAH